MKKSIMTRLMVTLVLTLCAWTTATAGAYSLTATPQENGSVAFKVGGSPVTSAVEGTTVTVVLNPADGYAAGVPTALGYLQTGDMKARRRVPGVGLNDGVEIPLTATANPNVYTFTMPAKDVEVSVDFADAYKLTKTDGSSEHGVVMLKSGATTVTSAVEDAIVTIVVDPVEAGYTVKDVTAAVYMKTDEMMARRRAPAAPALVGDLEVTKVDDTHWQFIMPAYDVEVDVTYEYNVKTIEASWIADIDDQTYTGSALTPALTITDPETSTLLVLGTDYTVVYSNNTDEALSTQIPAPTVTVTGIGNYTGTVSKTFTILPAPLAVTATGFEGTYDAQAHSIYVTVPTTGATIMYGTTSGNYTEATNPSYTNVGTYTVYYKVSTTNPHYADVTGSAVVKIDARELTAATLTETEKVYNESEQTFTVATVTAGTMDVPDTDYEVTDNKATAVGNNYTAKITGTGNFTGTVEVPYRILPSTVTDNQLFTISISPTEYDYDRTAKTPTVTIKNKSTGAAIENYTDYFDIAYSNNTNAGTATVTVTAKTTDPTVYYGIKTATFTINKVPLEVQANSFDVPYGETPTFTATYSGLVTGDNLDGTLVYGCSYVPNVSALGVYDIIPSGVTSNNYDITFTNGTLTVIMATPTVNVPTANALTYTGTEQALINAGTATGGTMWYKINTGDWNTSIPTATDAGTYNIYYKVVGDVNHNDVDEAGPVVVTIAKAQLIVKANDLEVEYGATPSFTASYNGFVNSETTAVLGGTLSYACDYPGATEVGLYEITPSGLTASNYEIVYSPGTLTVTAKTAPPTITLDPMAFEYTGEACVPTVTVMDGSTPIPSNEYAVSYSNNINAAASTAENAPTVTITDNPGGAYTVNGTKTFTITQATNAFLTPPTIEGWSTTETPKVPTGGTVKFGTIVYKYSTSASGPWDTFESVVTGEGTFYVKGVVDATTNYTGVESNVLSFEVTAPPMALVTPPTPVIATLTYTGSPQTLFIPGVATGGDLKYKVTTTNTKPTDTSDFTTTIDQGTNAGTYYLWYYIDGGAAGVTEVNDDPVVKTIFKAQPEYTAPPVVSGLVYDGLAHALITAGSTTDGTMEYSQDGSVWTTDATTITGTDAMTYHVFFRVLGDENHLDLAPTMLTVTIDKRDISKTTGYADNKYVTITTIDQTWTDNTIDIGDVYTIVLDTDPTSAPYNLTSADYNVFVTQGELSVEIREPGRYTIAFIGKGNFEGMVSKTFDVKKDISPAGEALHPTGVVYDIPTQVLPLGGTFALNMSMDDELLHTTMYKDEDYTLKYYEADAGNAYAKSTTEITDPATITAEGKYWVTITGQAPRYTGSIDKPFYVVKEYQTVAATTTAPAMSFRIDVNNPGYPDNTPKGQANVGAATTPAIDVATKTLTIPATFSVEVADQTITYDVVGIENNAFAGCTDLRWIDAKALESFTPSSLERQTSGAPFSGLPLQTLVYLSGTNVQGENYIYRNDDLYLCNEFKIFDDVSGMQKHYESANDYKWEIEVPIAFTADRVTNTRMLTGDKYYTTCLPYAMKLNGQFEAYTVEAASDRLVGFHQLDADATLQPYTPYLLLATTTGNLLCTENVTIGVTPAEETLKKLGGTSVSNNKAYFYGSVRYMDTELNGKNAYILQANHQWMLVDPAAAYNPDEGTGVCVLPMRAYITLNSAMPARRFLSSTFVKGVSEAVMQTEDRGEVYSLQGMKMNDTPLRKGLYIIDGKKVVIK